MKVYAVLASAPALCLVTGEYAHAQSLAGSVGLASDYIFRGLTQTQNDPSLQAELVAGWESGFYAGAWAGSVDFGDFDDASLELDLFAGWVGEAGPVNLDVMGMLITYPGGGGDDQEFFEGSVTASYVVSDLTLEASAYASPDFYGSIGPSLYVSAAASYAVTDAISVDVTAGNSTFYDQEGLDYSDFSAGVSYSHNDITVSARHHWGTDFVDSKWAVSISKSF